MIAQTSNGMFTALNKEARISSSKSATDANVTVEKLSLIDATAEDLQLHLQNGDLTSVDLVNAYVARIKEVNPSLKAVMEINPDAWTIAEELDKERDRGDLRGPLHGLPVLLKGNIGTKDRMETNAGSYALQGSRVSRDATIVSKLREHGLIVLGKASLTEWSMFRSNNASRAWNAISGQCYGAHVEKQCPGGSSGGSAVAVDLGLAWAAIATETSGSIISPCDRNGVVGIKPTVGLTSRHMVVPVSEHQDSVGTVARTVKDAAALLQVIAGVDLNDTYMAASPFKIQTPDYIAAYQPFGLHGKRIGVASNVLTAHGHLTLHSIRAFEDALSKMAEAGATVIENTNFTAYERWLAREVNPVTRADFRSNIAQYFANLEHNPHNIKNLEELRDFVRHHPLEEFPARNTANWDWAIDRELDNTSPEFESLYEENLYLGGEGGILGALGRHRLDAVVLPSAIAYEIPALVGSPIVTVPLGVAAADTPLTMQQGWDVTETGPGLPFGISFLGAKWNEEELIGMAYAFEQLTMARDRLKRIIEPRTEAIEIVSR